MLIRRQIRLMIQSLSASWLKLANITRRWTRPADNGIIAGMIAKERLSLLLDGCTGSWCEARPIG